VAHPTAVEAGPAASRQSWAQEGRDLIRAASGGLLFGVPLLYTMEVWWLGSHTAPGQMLLTLALLFVALLGLNATAGFRSTRDVSVVEAAEDAIESIAVGIVATTVVLVVLRQIALDTPVSTVLGSVVNECIPFCLGVGVARFLLQGDPGMAEDEEDLRGSAADIGATALGAAFVGLSIAPTDEVPMLASAMSPAWQVLLVAATLIISYTVVFVAGFSGQDRRRRHHGVFDRPATETLVTYLVALAVAAGLLWVFQRGVSPPSDLLARVVVLGLPASVGGAVGRLAL